MILLVLFAFIAGVVTILSPCILPILPIVLSGAVGGAKRPYGIMLGFIASFTFFTLFLATIVRSIGLSADVIRSASIVIIFAFGLSLLIPGFQLLVEKLFAKFSGKLPSQTGSGFMGGVLIGLSLGLLWTPCVGPILASVISLALTGSVNGAVFVITVAYAFGTAIPMFIIITTGRRLFERIPWLLAKSGVIQKAFGVVMLLTALAIAGNIDRKFQTYVLSVFPNYGTNLTQFENNQKVLHEIDGLTAPPMPQEMKGKPMNEIMNAAPDFIAGGVWLNSEPLTLAKLQGKVVLVDFWTYTCINCIRTFPYLRDWYEKYNDEGFVIVGVHTPEFEFEKNVKNVSQALNDYNLTFPVMQDNDYKTWNAYKNRYWPAKYLIDKTGRIRYTHFGEGKYEETEMMIQKLLSEDAAPVTKDLSQFEYSIDTQTPETYLGYTRMQYLVTSQTVGKNIVQTYTAPEEVALNRFAFNGDWMVGNEYAKASPGASLTLRFFSKNVFLVMRPTDGKSHFVEVVIDRGSKKTVTVDSDRLYTLIELPRSGDHTLNATFVDGNIEVFAFTFG